MVDTPQILEKPFMTNDVKMKMIEEFKDILTEYIVKSAKEAELIKDPTVTEFQKTLRSTYENELNTFKASKKLSLDLQEDEIRRRRTSSHSAGPLTPLNLIGRRKENRVECYNEVGSALTSLLKGTAFQIHPKSVPFEIMDYFCGEGFLERVPLVVFNKVVGRIWPGSLRRYAYEIHLRMGGRDFRTGERTRGAIKRRDWECGYSESYKRREATSIDKHYKLTRSFATRTFVRGSSLRLSQWLLMLPRRRILRILLSRV